MPDPARLMQKAAACKPQPKADEKKPDKLSGIASGLKDTLSTPEGVKKNGVDYLRPRRDFGVKDKESEAPLNWPTPIPKKRRLRRRGGEERDRVGSDSASTSSICLLPASLGRMGGLL